MSRESRTDIDSTRQDRGVSWGEENVVEGNALGIGMSLGTISIRSDDKPAKAARDELRGRIEALSPGIDGNAVAAAFRKVQAKRWGYQWAPPVYHCVERQLRSLPA